MVSTIFLRFLATGPSSFLIVSQKVKTSMGKAHPDNALRWSGSLFRIGREMELGELLEGVHAQVRRAASSSDGEYPQPVANRSAKSVVC
jgi:hypothetical protein